MLAQDAVLEYVHNVVPLIAADSTLPISKGVFDKLRMVALPGRVIAALSSGSSMLIPYNGASLRELSEVQIQTVKSVQQEMRAAQRSGPSDPRDLDQFHRSTYLDRTIAVHTDSRYFSVPGTPGWIALRPEREGGVDAANAGERLSAAQIVGMSILAEAYFGRPLRELVAKEDARRRQTFKTETVKMTDSLGHTFALQARDEATGTFLTDERGEPRSQKQRRVVREDVINAYFETTDRIDQDNAAVIVGCTIGSGTLLTDKRIFSGFTKKLFAEVIPAA